MAAHVEPELSAWLGEANLSVSGIEALTGDVSRRRYYRVSSSDGETSIAVYYPLDLRPVCSRFLATSTLLSQSGVRVPRVLKADCDRGVMILEDLGSRAFYDLAGEPWDSLRPLYLAALELIGLIQALPLTQVAQLNPALDGSALRAELELCWSDLLDREQVSGPAALRSRLEEALDELCGRLDVMPLVPCHRDFMARNLLLDRKSTELVVIDHQDLRPGPRFYDLASLLNDSLFPPPEVERPLRTRAVTGKSEILEYRRCVVQRALKASHTYVKFARLGDPRHLPLVRPTLARAAYQLARLPEGGPFVRMLAENWRRSRPEMVAGAAGS